MLLNFYKHIKNNIKKVNNYTTKKKLKIKIIMMIIIMIMIMINT